MPKNAIIGAVLNRTGHIKWRQRFLYAGGEFYAVQTTNYGRNGRWEINRLYGATFDAKLEDYIAVTREVFIPATIIELGDSDEIAGLLELLQKGVRPHHKLRATLLRLDKAAEAKALKEREEAAA